MQNLTGSYIWHYVSDESKIEGIKEDHEYLVCLELEEEKGPAWKMKLACWYEKGAKITISESDGTPHEFRIDKDGFYLIDDFNKAPRFFHLRGVRYWTEIQEPGVKPEDTLTVVE